ncbi:MFS transporter [Kocuria palustris]|jgi:fucose permease|uniref:MFS transporter n=1 Tax=Kocuria palustris TaxID=71999 RepID=UPI0019CF82F1|nr:MFS transporter [Kocuria palustris]MBN6753321.1 MFS transporter [Kocuria palustris]MBN6758164.1 MFS transporter [Kocuria palustris]MBN6763192.1 MFS transporter [Kocuria palustris]MBN6782826.1 MFS transporter [Kocuria palustris]MBN6798963.1 MFS transporter [Kocuria palustris]
MPSPAGSFLSPERLRRARLGAALLFLVNGAVFANLLPRLPQIKDAFELSNSVYGFVVIAFPLGSLLAGTAPAPTMRRWGSGRTAVMGSVAIALMILLAGVSGGIGGGLLVLLAYIVPLMLAGMLDAITDTAQNAQALDVQRAMGRSILNSMHALWSLGSVIGGLMGTAALALQVPLAVHLAISGILFSAVAVFAGTRVLTMEEVARVRPLAESSAQQDALPADGPEPAQDLPGLSEQDAPGVAAAAHEPSSGAASAATASPGSAGPARRAVLMLLLISVVSITGVMVEDLGQNWSALYLSQVLEASATMAGLGLVALMCAQFIGRLLGDRMVDRLGHVTMARLGAVGIAAGLGLVVAAPAPAAAVAGFFLAGLGSATLVPSAYHAADLVPGLRPGTGLAVVSWLMRGAFLSLSPFVGVVSDALGLRLAFLVIPVAAVLAVLAAGHLRQPART